MGMAVSRALATSTLVKPCEFLYPIPDTMSCEEAATLPVVYMTCYYGLIVRGKLRPGETVLIHSGTGGVGLAALRICLSMGCRIFTTVGKREKREFLKKLFPQLKDENITNSRDVSFERHIMRKTRGRGIDMVLNSLDGKRLFAGLRLLRYISCFSFIAP